MFAIIFAAIAVATNLGLVASVGLNLFSRNSYKTTVDRGLAWTTAICSGIALLLTPFNI